MTEPAVQFNRLGHFYKAEKWLFRNCQAEISRGTVCSILGPNGCGKTTLLRILLGTLKPAEGTFSLNGAPAFVPQLFQVGFDYTVLDMVLMGRARSIRLFSQPGTADEEAALQALDRFGMAEFASHSFHELSGGERQLVIFARALLSRASILILDEPTSALDLRNQSIVLSWITRLAQEDGMTIVFTTHHPHHALAVADTACLMFTADQVIASGPAPDLLSEENLRKLYGTDIKRIEFEHRDHTIRTLVPVYFGTYPNQGPSPP